MSLHNLCVERVRQEAIPRREKVFIQDSDLAKKESSAFNILNLLAGTIFLLVDWNYFEFSCGLLSPKETMAFYLLCWFVLHIGQGDSTPTQAKQNNDAQDILYASLMKDYQKDVRPTSHHWLPTNVTFGFLLQAIVDLDEKNQILTTRAWMNIVWVDERLAWNPTDFSNLTSIQVPNTKIWKPDIILTNNADQTYEGETMSTDVFVLRTGNVSWLASALFKSSCRIRVKYFPFDDQVCMINFTSWSHNGNELQLRINTEEGDLSSYTRNSEFHLTSMTVKKVISEKNCCPNKPWPLISISIWLTRIPFFYVFNHILPGTLLAAMGMLGFLIPSDSGEKVLQKFFLTLRSIQVTMCITTMLAMGVYLKTVTETVPASEELPLLGMYYAVLFLMVGLTTMGNIWILNLHMSTSAGSQDREISQWTRTWVLDRLGSVLLVSKPDIIKRRIAEHKTKVKKDAIRTLLNVTDSVMKFGGSNVHANTTNTCLSSQSLAKGKRDENFGEVAKKMESAFSSVVNDVYKTLVRNDEREAAEMRKSDIVLEWKNLAMVIDRFLLVIFVVTTTITSVLILFQPAYVSKK